MKNSLLFSESGAKCLIICTLSLTVFLASCSTLSQPEITPTSLASIPAQTAAIVMTPSPSETPISTATNPESIKTNKDVMYVWQKPFYGYLTNNHVIDPLSDMHTIRPTANKGAPSKALNLFFSPYFDDVAYIVVGEHKELEVWVSSLDLSNSRLVWTDSNNILDYSSSSIDQGVNIQWGPNARFIIVSLEGTHQSCQSSINIVVDVNTFANYWLGIGREAG